MALSPLIPAQAGIQLLGPRFRGDERKNTHSLSPASTLVADPAGALYWPDEKLLAVADLHLEKGSAFAARGVLLPPYDTAATLGAARAAHRALRAASRDRARRQLSRRRRPGAHGDSQPRRAQGAAARPRLGLDRRQSRSRSGGRYRRPLRRHFGARRADLSSRAFAASRATAKLPAICIRWRAWRGAAAR